jgi:hypothetical protein
VVESWVRAEVVNIISVSEMLATGRAIVRYDIQNAPVKDFRVRVPATYTNVEIYGVNIRRRDRDGQDWRVELQSKVRGTYTLTVAWEQPRTAKTNAPIDVAGVQSLGTERETGNVVLLVRPPLQLTERSVSEELQKIDAGELPSWAGVSAAGVLPGGEVPALVYRYLRPAFKLSVEARRFEEAALLQALVDDARFTTVVADDGQMMTELVLAIRNNGLQHLEIELPPKAIVWSAFVAGQPVRPTKREGRLLLPLERSGADEAPVSVELTYISADKFPKRRGKVAFASPKLAVPLKNARWEVYLPPDYAYANFEGSMSHEAAAAPVVQVYSSADYLRQEQQKVVEKKAEIQSFLSNARRGLTEGKFKGANVDFNNASRLNAFADVEANRELESLKKDLGRAQSSNLIQAQRAYTVENFQKLGGQAEPAMGQQAQPAQQLESLVQYDADAAERQWGALQKAQEVVVARVQPLRANLPTRGQKHSFTQVLQTEINKPMTIQFAADNTKQVGWFKRLLSLGGLFVVLWIVTAVVMSRRTQPTQAT